MVCRLYHCVLDLMKNLANASEESIRSFLQSLKDSRSLAAEDLQENVFKNYNEFVTISKEISTLESDMQTLRGLLDDLKTASDNLVDDDDEFLLTAGKLLLLHVCLLSWVLDLICLTACWLISAWRA